MRLLQASWGWSSLSLFIRPNRRPNQTFQARVFLVSTTEALSTPIGRRRLRQDVLVQFSSVPSGSCRLPSHGLGRLLSITLALDQVHRSIDFTHQNTLLVNVSCRTCIFAFFDEDPKNLRLNRSFLAEQGKFRRLTWVWWTPMNIDLSPDRSCLLNAAIFLFPSEVAMCLYTVINSCILNASLFPFLGFGALYSLYNIESTTHPNMSDVWLSMKIVPTIIYIIIQ